MRKQPQLSRLRRKAQFSRHDVERYLTAFIPTSVLALRQGYSLATLSADAFAGLTVAILALPLSLAIAIGSGVDPAKGLITAMVAGFIVSALGGTRLQVGGPAAAFIVIVADIAASKGVSGLVAATFMAGAFLALAAAFRFGDYIKYVPGPVILGFTAGVGVLILIGQLRDFFGITTPVSSEVIHKLQDVWNARSAWSWSAMACAVVSIVAINVLRKHAPRLPGLLFVIAAVSAAAAILGLDVATIGGRYGEMPRGLPAPALPALDISTVMALLPTALTLALLIGVELLLSAVTADALAGTRHNPNAEILGQGVANMAAALFGGIPATGVIARTGTNITAGGQTPVAGMLHAVFLLALVAIAAPLVKYLALPALAAVLMTVGWRLIEPRHLWHFMTRAPRDDLIVLLATLLLTVFAELNTAIATGVVLASIFFMHRMAEVSGVEPAQAPRAAGSAPSGQHDAIKIMTFRGPLFFGQSTRVADALQHGSSEARVLVLDMAGVPLIDFNGYRGSRRPRREQRQARVPHDYRRFAGPTPHCPAQIWHPARKQNKSGAGSCYRSRKGGNHSCDRNSRHCMS